MKSLSYKDIYLVPKYSELESRDRADTGIWLRDKYYKLPILPSNMNSVINKELAKYMSENGYLYIFHRFDGSTNKKDPYHFIEEANKEKWRTISISIGVQKEDVDLIEWINHRHKRVDFITIDIAHSHHKLVKDFLTYLNSEFLPNEKPFIIAGNVATSQGVIDLATWGADAVKYGIGGGGICSTKNHTGFHVPMFSCGLDCNNWGVQVGYPRATGKNKTIINGRYIYTIADGGVRENGDIAKALASGADMAMAAGLFAACIDSPAENIYSKDGKLISCEPGQDLVFEHNLTHKKYFGSASRQNGNTKNIEGHEVIIPCNQMTYAEKLEEIRQDLSSSISYAGGSNLECLKDVGYVQI
jgi:GMP reductase